MLRVLVTGASGFIGTNLIGELQRAGCEPIGVSRRIVPTLHTIQSYDAHTDWSRHLNGVDAVVHLAARAHVLRDTSSDPLAEFRRSNVAATTNLARQASAAGVRRFIFLSSIGVNGNRTSPGQHFTANDIPNPQNAYALSKAEAEESLTEISSRTGLEVVSVRPPLVYGPRVPANFKRLMKLAAAGVPSIFSGVSNVRSFVYVNNLCDLIISAIKFSEKIPKILLVSDGHDISTDRLYRDLAAALGKTPVGLTIPEVVLRLLGKATGTVKIIDQLTCNLQVDVSETYSALNWRPPYQYEQGIRATADAFTGKL